MKTDNAQAIQTIRSLGVAYVNRIVPAARHLQELRSAFAEWNAGNVYVCKKTGDFRYRYGADSKHLTPWSKQAREVFSTVSAFALAALIFEEETKPAQEPAKPANIVAMPKQEQEAKPGKRTSRADVLKIAIAGGAA